MPGEFKPQPANMSRYRQYVQAGLAATGFGPYANMSSSTRSSARKLQQQVQEEGSFCLKW
jgi:hypothetical protein